MTEYLSDFVQESKDHITDLNNALLDLERDPDDDEAMDRVFRTAHTLKGNAGAMGLDRAGDLSHALEDLLDAIRNGRVSVSPDMMDVVFETVDVLERMIDQIEDYGEIRSDPQEQIRTLRSWLEESPGVVEPRDTEVESILDGVERAPREHHQAYHAWVAVAEDENGGPILDALRDAFDVLATDPSESVIRNGDHRGSVDVVFGSAVGKAAIAAAMDPVEAVEDAIVTQIDDRMIEAEADRTDAPEIDDGPEDLSVDRLLDQFTEYDDLDEAVEQVDDIAGFDVEELGEAGAFDDVVDEEVRPAYEDTAVPATAEPEPEPEPETEPEREEVEDPMAEFQELKQEYDRVGLDRMEEELEGVEFGEYDVEDEVGFDELLGEVGVDTEPAGPAVESPEDADVRAAIQVATTPSDPEQDVYHVRLGIVEDEGINNGQLVVEALRDAFDLLGTRPSEDQISLGQYDDHVDAVFGAEVGVVEIEAALEPVEEVSDAAITEVTHRFDVEPPKPEPEPEAEGAAGTAEATGTTGTAEAADVEPGDIDSEVLNAEGEIQDTRTEFQQMQRAFDQVGLDQLEDELEDVKFGEYDTEDEVGFDELLDEVESMEAEAERKAEAESAPARPTVEPPDDEAIAATIEAAKSPDVPDNDVFHVRLAIVETRDSDVNNGQLVVEALRDAFDLLGTQPTEPEIDRGEYGDHVDAAFASHVGVAEIEAALEPVEEVSDAAITEVTHRFDVEPPEPEPEVEAEAETTATDEPGTEAATGAAAGDDVNDPMAEFEKLKDEYDPVGIDQMEAELEGVEFGNTAPADELDFQELLEDVPSPEEADLGGTTVEEFGEPEPGTEEFGDVEVAEPGTEEFGDVGVAEPGTEEFGDVEVAEQTEAGGFGDVETAEPEEGPSEGPDSAAADVRSISGIGANYAERLASAGVETVGDLVTTDPETLSTETNISDSHISEWIDRAPVEPADVGPTAEPESEPEPISAESEVGVGLGATEPEPEPEPERELDEIQSIRVDVDRIDELLNLVEGLVTSRTRLRRAVEQGADPETLLDEIEELDLISEEMQDHVVDMRLVPARSVTERLPRVVRDIARKQEKRVRFEVEGEGVEVDRSILNRVGDPLVHLIRNAVDHGIESPQEREASGKPAEGQITLQIRRRRDDVIIEVEDDGRGLDPDGLRGRAVEEGVLDEEVGKALSDKDAYQLIFESGFSMREEVTDVSGRGVGMNVVSNAVEELDGDIEIESEPDEGTTIRLVLPVSVAISEVIFLESGDEEYGVPIQVVDEIEDTATIEHLDDGQIRTPDGVVRELIDLHEALDVPGQAVADGGGGSMLVTVETDVRQAAIRCENVRGQQEVVVKPFEGLMSGIPGLSGAAVLGAGEVVNILDVETL